MAIRKFFILFITLAVPAAVFARGDAGNPHSCLAAYESYVHGEQFTYHSAHPGISAAMLIRSMQEELYIEWSTQKVPPDYREGPATFVFLAAINVHEHDSHGWDIMVNGKKSFP